MAAPAAPTDLTETLYDIGQVSIEFIPPTADPEITAFEFQVGTGAWTEFSGPPLRVTGFNPSTEITIGIRAVNADGDGEAETVTFTTLPLPPDWDEDD